MWHGIEAVQPGRPISDIGRAIENHAKKHRYGVVRSFVGHGIGEQFHTDIQVLHYYDQRASTIMRPGMTFTIEPMITLGAWQHRIWDDGWTAVTTDGKRTAQFEHTVLVTDDGVEVLTGGPTAASRDRTRGSAEPPLQQCVSGRPDHAVGGGRPAAAQPATSPARSASTATIERPRRQRRTRPAPARRSRKACADMPEPLARARQPRPRAPGR